MYKYLNAEMIFDVGTDNECHIHVAKFPRGLDDTPIVYAHTNPLFVTQKYDVYFSDGLIEKYTEKLILENIFVQVDS